MNKLKTQFINFFTHGFDKKTVFAIFILGAADVFTFAAPLYLKYIIPGIHDYMNIDQHQFDFLTSLLGYTKVATNLLGGWFAARFSNKKLIIIALCMTASLAVWWVMLIHYSVNNAMFQYSIIYLGWGASTTLFFWTPLWKLLSQLGSKKSQGSLFGLQGTHNGILGVVFITAGGAAATALTAKFGTGPFTLYGIMICLFLYVSALGIFFFVKENKDPSKHYMKNHDLNNKKTNELSAKEKKEKSWAQTKKTLNDVWQSLKSIRLWLTAFFILGMYMFQSVFAYYMKNAMSIIGLVGFAVVFLAGLRTYAARVIVSSPFGKWIDKRASYFLISIFILTIGIFLALIFTFMPAVFHLKANHSNLETMMLKIFMGLCYVVVGFMSWCLVAIRFVQVVEIPIRKGAYSIVVGFISMIAFSPDAWFYTMASFVGRHHEIIRKGNKTGSYDSTGLMIILSIALGIALFGLLCGVIVHIMNKKEMKQLNKPVYRWRKLTNS